MIPEIDYSPDSNPVKLEHASGSRIWV